MPFRELTYDDDGWVGIGIDITEKCNRKCPTCYMAPSQRHMRREVFCAIVDQGYKLGFRELYILGGEPTLHPRLIEFLEYAKQKFKLVILVTNMDKLSNVSFTKKIFETGVTVDGQKHVTSDTPKNRFIEELLSGGKHFETSMRAWEIVEKIFPPEKICVQCCITSPVVESKSIYDVFRYARARGFEPIMEFTKEGDKFKRGCRLDVPSSIMMKVLEKFKQIDINEFDLKGAEIITPQAYGKTCHMLENCIHFLVDGTAIPCVGHHNFGLGNIYDIPLELIMENPIHLAMADPHNWIYGYCRDECEYFEMCTGGCRGSAFDMTGCPRASFYYCPHIPHDKLSLRDMIPPSCDNCILRDNPNCHPKV
jgi:radical SAM protein with 4Fe4S-binding SPASM domain